MSSFKANLTLDKAHEKAEVQLRVTDGEVAVWKFSCWAEQ